MLFDTGKNYLSFLPTDNNWPQAARSKDFSEFSHWWFYEWISADPLKPSTVLCFTAHPLKCRRVKDSRGIYNCFWTGKI